MAALDTLNSNILALAAATTDLTAAVATIPTGTVAVGGATEAQVQTAADGVAAQTAVVTAQAAAIRVAVTPPAPVPVAP